MWDTAGKLRIYMASFYFVSTVWTTVGFGDIGPANPVEQIYCVFLMFVGSLVFATLLSEVQNMHERVQRVQLGKVSICFYL